MFPLFICFRYSFVSIIQMFFIQMFIIMVPTVFFLLSFPCSIWKYRQNKSLPSIEFTAFDLLKFDDNTHNFSLRRFDPITLLKVCFISKAKLFFG